MRLKELSLNIVRQVSKITLSGLWPELRRTSASADHCELALRRVSKETGHTYSGYVESRKVGNWPLAPVGDVAVKLPLGKR